MKILVEVDVTDEERKAIAKKMRVKGRANRDEVKIFIGENLVARGLDEVRADHLGETHLPMDEFRHTRELDLCRGARVIIPLSAAEEARREGR